MAARRPALIAKKARKPRVTYNETYLVNKKYLGDEPVFKKEMDHSDFIKALNWYNYMCTTEDARQYLSDFLKANGRLQELKTLSRVSDNWFPNTIGWVARIWNNGTEPPKGSKKFFELKLKETLARAEPAKEATPNVERMSVQDRMREKSHDIIGDIEAMIDSGEDFSLYDWLKQKELPAAYCIPIAAKYAPWLEELFQVLDGTDPQLKEAYRHFTKKQIRERIVFLNKLLEDCERYGSVTKKTRAPRKPRAQSKEKILKLFKYQKEDGTYKIASINPDKILGAQELWTFNTKTKVVTVFRAMGPAGLTVSRTSIGGYDDKSSFSRGTGRQTEKVLDKVQNGGKIVLRKLIDELKTEKALQARINENTILMRTV